MKTIFVIVFAAVLMATVAFFSLAGAALVELKASMDRKRKG
jgi:hypothetical protein